jgi:hypothetical protein
MKTLSQLQVRNKVCVLKKEQQIKILGGSDLQLGGKVEAKTKESTTALG